jgi:tetratricopeptide (TPR) repeat protein
VAAFQKGDFKAAKEGFAAALKEDPSLANAAFNLGLCEERLGKPDAAIVAYQKALAGAPKHEGATLNLGRLFETHGQEAKAVALYEAGLAQKGNGFNARLLHALAQAYRHQRRYPDAEQAWRRALSRNANDVESYKGLSLLYYDEGNLRLAEVVALAAKRLAEKDPAVHNNLGMVYLKEGEVVRALAAFKRAAELAPDFAAAYRNWGALALAYRDYASAHTAYAHLLALRPDDPSAICGEGEALGQDARSADQARPFLTRCVKAAGASSEEVHAAKERLSVMDARPPATPSASAPGAPVPATLPGDTPPALPRSVSPASTVDTSLPQPTPPGPAPQPAKAVGKSTDGPVPAPPPAQDGAGAPEPKESAEPPPAKG